MIYRRFLAISAGMVLTIAVAFSGVIRAATDAATMTFLKISYTAVGTGSTIYDSAEIYSINSSGVVLDAGHAKTIDTTTSPGKEVAAFTDKFVKCFADANVGAQAIRINDAGDIAGVRSGSVAGVVASGFVCKASGELVNVNVPGALSTVVRGFNNNGDVSGYYQDQFGAKHGYIFKNSTFTKIDYVGTPANPFSGTVIYAINDKGDAVGSSEDSKHDTQAFIYSSGLIKPLPTLPAAPSKPTSFPAPYVGIMEPRGINNNGQVVGTYTYFDSSLAGKSMGIVLNGASWQLVDYPNAANTSFWAINDKGQIAGGFGNNYLSPENGFIANPILLDADVFDATGIAASANEKDGVLYDKSKSALNEAALSAFNPAMQAKGLVADGNARLIIRTKSNVSGTITVTVNNKPIASEPNTTGTSATVYPVLASGTVNADGSASLSTQEVATGTQLPHQASFTLKAGYDYSGDVRSVDSPFSIDLCLKKSKDSTVCDATRHIVLAERRVPVILMHGLWARDTSFGDATVINQNSSGGLLGNLALANYNVTTYSFDGNAGGNDGPSRTMAPTQNGLSNQIQLLCASERLNGIACTRSVIIGHSMGGLVARKYIFDNDSYKSTSNFGLGSVAKFIGIGTPHYGSGLAKFLNGHLPCQAQQTQPQIDARLTIERILNKGGRLIGSAISDLEPGSSLLTLINSRSQSVPTYLIAGNTGVNDITLPLIGSISDLDPLLVQSGCTRNDIFSGAYTDGIVPILSASGKVANRQVLTGVQHIGMGRNQNVEEVVLSVLTMKTSDGYDKSMIASSFEFVNKLAKSSAKWIAESFVVVLLGVGSAHAASNFSLSASNNTPAPGQFVTFSVTDAAGIDAAFGYRLVDDSTGESKSFPPGSRNLTFQVPSSAQGTSRYYAIALVNSTPIQSNFVDLIINRSSELKQIKYLELPGLPSGSHFVVTKQLGERRLLVIGRGDNGSHLLSTADGLKFLITDLSGNPSAIASISDDGTVKGIDSGDFLISINFGNLHTKINGTVREAPADLVNSPGGGDVTNIGNGNNAGTTASKGGGAASHYFIGGLLLAALALPGSRARRPAIAGPKAQCT